MRQRVLGFGSILLVPACSLYFGTNGHDAGVEAQVDAGRAVDAGGAVDAPVDAGLACGVVEQYDWNDGTAQGWTASTSVTNAGGSLVFTNQGNGSLQAFGPEAPSTLDETDSISFTVRIDHYSAVTSPSQLTGSTFALDTPFPGDGSLEFPLDVSTLAFGQAHVFRFQVADGTFTGSLTRAAFLAHVKFASVMFADQGFTANTSAGTLDDFTIVQTAGCVPIGIAGR